MTNIPSDVIQYIALEINSPVELENFVNSSKKLQEVFNGNTPEIKNFWYKFTEKIYGPDTADKLHLQPGDNYHQKYLQFGKTFYIYDYHTNKLTNITSKFQKHKQIKISDRLTYMLTYDGELFIMCHGGPDLTKRSEYPYDNFYPDSYFKVERVNDEPFTFSKHFNERLTEITDDMKINCFKMTAINDKIIEIGDIRADHPLDTFYILTEKGNVMLYYLSDYLQKIEDAGEISILDSQFEGIYFTYGKGIQKFTMAPYDDNYHSYISFVSGNIIYMLSDFIIDTNVGQIHPIDQNGFPIENKIIEYKDTSGQIITPENNTTYKLIKMCELPKNADIKKFGYFSSSTHVFYYRNMVFISQREELLWFTFNNTIISGNLSEEDDYQKLRIVDDKYSHYKMTRKYDAEWKNSKIEPDVSDIDTLDNNIKTALVNAKVMNSIYIQTIKKYQGYYRDSIGIIIRR